MKRLAAIILALGGACAAPVEEPGARAARMRTAPEVRPATLETEAALALDAGCEDRLAGTEIVLEVLPEARELAVARVDGVARCVDAVPALVEDLTWGDAVLEAVVLERYAEVLGQPHGAFGRRDDGTPRLAHVAPREPRLANTIRAMWAPLLGDPHPIPVDLPPSDEDDGSDPFQGDPHPIPVDPNPDLDCEDGCAPRG